MSGNHPDLQLDAARYRALRRLAIDTGSLEANVAIAQLDFCENNKQFDNAVDCFLSELKKYLHKEDF